MQREATRQRCTCNFEQESGRAGARRERRRLQRRRADAKNSIRRRRALLSTPYGCRVGTNLHFSNVHFCMSQGGCPEPNPAHGRWWMGRALRSQHYMDRSSLGFESWWPRRALRRMISARRVVRMRDRFCTLPERTGHSHAKTNG